MFLMPCSSIVWAELSWHSPILQNHCNFHASSFLNHFWKYVTEVSEWVTAQHAPFFFVVGTYGFKCWKGAPSPVIALGDRQVVSSGLIWRHMNERSRQLECVFVRRWGRKKSRGSKPLFPTVRFKTSSRQIWHHYSDSNHNSLCLNVSHLNYKDRCDKKIFGGILGF